MVKKISSILAFTIVSILMIWNPVFGKTKNYQVNHPKLVFKETSQINFQNNLYQSPQNISNGKILRDSDKIQVIKKWEQTELILSEKSILRFEDQTEFDFFVNEWKKYEIVLKEGSIWSNVKDLDLKITAGNLQVVQNSSVVNIQREEWKTKIQGIRYNTKINLIDQTKKTLNEIFLPSNNEVTFLDSQISPSYSKLKLSKLKKELKFQYTDNLQIKSNPWFKKNLEDDLFWQISQNSTNINYTSLFFTQAKFKLNDYLSFLIFNPNNKAKNSLNRINTLYNLAFLAESSDQRENFGKYLSEIDSTIQNSSEKNKEEILLFLVEKYYQNRFIAPIDRSYLIKENLIKNIQNLSDNNQKKEYITRFWIDELNNLENYLDKYEIIQANEILKSIINQWNTINIFSETEKNLFSQTKIICYSNLFKNLNNLNASFLETYLLLDEIELNKLKPEDKNEAALILLWERINLATNLIERNNYKNAKILLSKNIESLLVNLNTENTSVKDYFAKLKNEIDKKISYIEKDLHGSAYIDQKNFKEYVDIIKSQEEAYAFVTAHQNSQTDSIQNTPQIETSIVVYDFSKYGISVTKSDIERLYNLPDKFIIKKAITSGGEVFNAKYNAKTLSVYDIQIDDKKINYSLHLSEINKTLGIKNLFLSIPQEEPHIQTNYTQKKNDLSFEIRKVAIIQILSDFQIYIKKENITLNENWITNAKSELDQKEISFNLDENIQTASNIYIQDYGFIQKNIPIANIITEIKAFILIKEKEKRLLALEKDLIENHLMFDSKKIQEESTWIFLIKNLFDQQNKIVFSCKYNLNENIFLEIDLGELGKFQNIRIENLTKHITEQKIKKEQAELANQIKVNAESESFEALNNLNLIDSPHFSAPTESQTKPNYTDTDIPEMPNQLLPFIDN